MSSTLSPIIPFDPPLTPSPPPASPQVLSEWNKGELDSFLIEITANILKYRDTDGSPLLEKIRDAAGQKGTGKWTAISALDYGVPVTLIGESVFARCLSSLKDERVTASKSLKGPDDAKFTGDKKAFIEQIRQVCRGRGLVGQWRGQWRGGGVLGQSVRFIHHLG